MTLFAVYLNPSYAGQIALAALLAAVGFFLLLPKPKLRSVAGGTAALAAALAVFAGWLYQTFGEPMPDVIGTALFCLFSLGALGFGTLLVVQSNPARGAISFAFVILSTCGLFLLLAAPFLMVATIIVYAGAVIVTFLFVLMLSQTAGPSDENDRSREPLLGSFAGFAFAGLVLFTLHQTQHSIRAAESDEGALAFRGARLPAPVLVPRERQALVDAAEKLRTFESDAFYLPPGPGIASGLERMEFANAVERQLEDVVGVSPNKEESVVRDGSIRGRLAGYRFDRQAQSVLERVAAVRDSSLATFRKIETTLADRPRGKPAEAKADAVKLREDVLLLVGVGELPARNVGNIGLLLYADHLLAVELAGTLLLVATIGAVAIVHRRGAGA